MSSVQHGFKRFVVSLQYHGSSFLGFTQQLEQENRILADGTDLRGYFTVESRVRQALKDLLLSPERYDNLQVSSRTDRGVHAYKNTFHIDLSSTIPFLRPDSIHRGLNFCLRRLELSRKDEGNKDNKQRYVKQRIRNSTQYMRGGEWTRFHPQSDIRILAVKEAPQSMSNPLGHLYNQASSGDWNARFSALSRTYIYRILHTVYKPDEAVPFEWDRSWRIQDARPFDINAMRQAAVILQGQHDFSSFRATRCQRDSPIMTIYDIQIRVEPYAPLFFGLDVRGTGDTTAHNQAHCQLITILYRGDSFVYRQVRNMTGCLVQVGRGKLTPGDVRGILEAKERRQAPQTAPAHGLFLVDVVHEGVEI